MEGFRGIFLHGFMSFAAVCVTVACLLIIGSFSAIMYNLNVMVTELNKTNEVLAFVDETLDDRQAESVGTDINLVDNVAQAVPYSREEALEAFQEDYKESGTFDDLDPNIFRYRFRITLKDNRLLEQTKENLMKVPGVVNVVAAEEEAAGFVVLQDVVQLLSLVIILVLLVVSLLIISNTVKLAVYDRRDEIAIMKMVGATNGFIRLPFIVQGFTLGMLGAVIAFGLEWLLYEALIARIRDLDMTGFFGQLVPFGELLGVLILIFVGAGTFVGVVGSWTSIRKFMNV